MENASIQQMIDLLDKKNSYLLDFQNLNNEEICRIQKGNFTNLEAFYYDREILLNAIDRVDHQLKKYRIDQFVDVCENSKKKVLDLLRVKKKFIHHILDQDMQIYAGLNVSAVNIEKTRIA